MRFASVSDLPAVLFVPGNKPELFDKALAGGAPAIVIDLEDAVAPDAKEQARAAVHAWFVANRSRNAFAGVRLNSAMNRFGIADLHRFCDGSVRPDFFVLPKVESATEVLQVHRLSGGVPLICIIESAIGLRNVFDIAQAAPSIAALGFGAADLSADLRATMDWEPMLAARSSVVQAAAAAGVGVLDVPYLNLRDESGLEAECRRVKALGFTGKFAIHPRHVAGVLNAFLPTEQEAARAAAILKAADAAHGNVVAFEGRMIDEAILRSARRTVALAKSRETDA
jgi:(S)-citramalyl-CoA lyase